ncbi:MAG: fimbria/pilus periplasmic chaperone [Alphaproteobacteria bacterium]|nr:fimbria/pilus periplasmic chaperone [Alphaproteobacteria bacterium]
MFKRLLLLVVTLAGAGAAYAYQVTPMIYDLKASGKGATTVIRIVNTTAAPITVEIAAERRKIDQAGKDTREAADADFVLFPPQAVVPAGATQAVRVQYVGPADLKESVMYLITAKQIPVKLPDDKSTAVKFVFNFSTVANVVPEGAKAQVETVSFAAAGGKGKLTIRNTGTKYANLALSSVALSGGGFSGTVKDGVWRKALGGSWILPGGTRVIDVPLPAGAPASGVTAKLEYVDAMR